MASSQKLGIEIYVDDYHSVTVFTATKVEEDEGWKSGFRAKQFDEFCRSHFRAQHFGPDPETGQVVGVFLPKHCQGFWLRGQVVQIITNTDNSFEYKVQLNDDDVVLVKRPHLITFDEAQLAPMDALKPPPLKPWKPSTKFIGLYGVLPVSPLNQKCKNFITGVFHKGYLFFKQKAKIGNMWFGDISIKPFNVGPRLSLTEQLLSNGLVKQVECFETEAQRFYSDLFLALERQKKAKKEEERETEEKGGYATNRLTEEKKENISSQTSAKICKEQKHSARDTGYCSSEDSDCDKRFFRPDVLLVPAGYEISDNISHQNKKSQKNKEGPILKNTPTNWFIIHEQNKIKEKRERRSRPKKNPSPKSVIASENHPKETLVPVQQPISDYHPYQLIFKQKIENCCDVNTQEPKDKSNDSKKRVRALNLNYKMNGKSDESDVSKNEPKTLNKDISDNIVNHKQEKVETSNKSKNNETVTSVSADDSKISTESIGATSTPISSLSKKQRISQKWKANYLEPNSHKSFESVGLIGDSANDSMVSAGSKSVTNTPDISLLSRKQGSQELIANKLETTFSSTSSYHPPSSYSSANNNFDSINSESAHNSQVSAESNILRSTPNSSLLSKKQRLSQKLKANNLETTFSSTNSFSKSFANKDFDSINSESADNSQISAESNSVRSTPDSSLLSIKQPLIQKLKVNNLETTFSSMSSSFTNKSFESVNSANNSKNSIDSGNSSTLSKKQRISKKLKTEIAFREEVEKIIKEEERKSHEDPLCSSGKMTDADSKQRIYSATDEDDRSFTSVASMSSKSSHTNSVLENATQGMLRRKKEAEMSMDNGKGDSISSCSQSVCSDDSSNILKLEKSTIKSLLTDLIVESESVEENFYVDASDLNSFVKYINTNVGVMIHSKDDRLIRPVPKINECFLHGHVVENLEKLRLRDMNRIQTVAYPAILARRNIAMISHLGTGKTVGYIVPLASHLSTSEYYDKLPKGFGPKILVVTPSWDSGEHVAYLFQKLCRGSTSILHCYGGGAELELRDKLLTGCDILVTTPRCLLRLLEYGFTNLDLLCHLVLDDADILLDKFKNEISKLLVAVDALEEARDQRQILVSLQIVVAARTWTRPVMELVTCILNDPVICIASQLEACVYAGIKPTAIFVQADKKVEKLVDILKEVEGKERTVVMCRTKDDVKYLYGVLIDLGVRNVIAAHEDLSGVSISEIPVYWNQNNNSCEEIWKEEASMPIMVRSDEVLEETPLTNASVLIHYNMPNSKTTFSHRLACMMQRYNNLLKKESKPKPQVFILLDEKNDLETPGVMEFMKRLGTVLPESVQCTIEEIEKTRQQKRMSEPLCEILKQFGECWDIKQCKARHTVYKELDNPDDVPRKGWVKMIVHHVHNASHFSVRLLEHAEEKDNWQRLPSNLLTLPFRLSNYFVVDKNKRMHGPPKVGDVVAVETSIDEYKRAVVLRITDYNKYKEVTNVDIQLIDNGRFDNRKVTDLFRLPDDMAKLPPSVVDMYLCAVKPKDLDTSWPTVPGRWVDEQLRQTRRQSPNGYLVGKIKFALRGSLWLDPVDYQEFLPELDTTVHLLNLRRDLLKANMATDNSNHLPALRRLCENAGIELPQEDPVVMKKVKQPHPQWAWLPVDEMEDVHIVVVENPEAIFVRQNKFNDNVDRLMKEVQEYAIAEKQPPNFDKMLDVGDCCLGKLSETEEWNRALVRSKPTEDTVELFFVDFGDTKAVPWNHVLPIPNKFITKLPFQVVECCLAGVKYFQDSDSKDWEDEVIDLIYDLSRDENEGAISLALKVCSVEDKAVYTGGRRYKVCLANLNVEPEIVINSRLLSSNYAELFNEDIGLVNGIKTKSVGENKSNESSDSEEDKKNLDVALPNAFKTEDELQMEEILRSLEARVDDFDFGIDFTNAKDDAERSNSLALPPAESEDLSKCPSNTINPPISSLSLSEVEQLPVSEVEQLPEALSTPLTHRYSQSHLSTSAKNWNVKELMTSNILGQSGGSPLLPFAQNISPRLKELSQIPSAFQDDDLDEESPRTLQWIGCIPESDSSLDQSHINEDLSFSQVAHDVQSDEIRTPMVEWYQDDIFVFIQIKLPALEAYNITFDIGNVNFSAKYSGVMYQVDLTLFGAHHRDRAEHSAEAFYVEIKLEKMLKGKKRWWPRLTRNEERLHWLKLNLEKVCPDSGSEASELEDMRIRLGYCDNRTETPTSIASSEMSELANSELSM